MRWAWGIALSLMLSGCSRSGQHSEAITIFAASSLVDILTEAELLFEASNPQFDILLSYAATSLLVRQIEQGAPADLFVSASQPWIDYLIKIGDVGGPARQLAGNKLVVAAQNGTDPMGELSELGRFSSIALADPSHVPAGIYGRQGLECLNLWEELSPNIVPTLDVRTALLSIKTGAAEVAIVYASDMLSSEDVMILLDWPVGCAPEIRYLGAVIEESPNSAGAAAFLEFIAHPEQGPLWEKHGFTILNP